MKLKPDISHSMQAVSPILCLQLDIRNVVVVCLNLDGQKFSFSNQIHLESNLGLGPGD